MLAKCPTCKKKMLMDITSEGPLGPKRCFACGFYWKPLFLHPKAFLQLRQEAKVLDKEIERDIERDYERKSDEARRLLLEK